VTILLINCFIGWHTTTAYFLRFNDGAVILMGFVLMVDSNPNPNLSLCHHRCPLVFNKTEQRRKKMVRIHCVLTILQFILLTYFSIKLLFLYYCVILDISAH
jgi:hypothetical protein